jgi:glycosyltransferase involved in cell wall biosynthesis
MASVSPGDVDRLRERYGLRGKLVVGYIGFIGEWVNVEMTVKAFEIFRKKEPRAALLWVGGSPFLASLREAEVRLSVKGRVQNVGPLL